MRGLFREERIAIDIEIYGVSPELKRTITALVDTGFSGSLTLPFTEAFPLGLVLKGEQSYLMADGSSSRHFVCLGTVIFAGKEVTVPIDVQQGGPVLVGMDLLKRLEMQLHIDFLKGDFEFSNSKRAKVAK